MRTRLVAAVIALVVVLTPTVSEAGFRGGYGFGKQKTFMTYSKNHPSGKIYIGRTSGAGKPADILAKRDSRHHVNGKGYKPAVPDRISSNKDAIRGREQQMIDKYKAEGRSGNAVNGISPKNRKRRHYLSEAEKEFGKP